jgi:flagellar motor switch protein FliN/FliY
MTEQPDSERDPQEQPQSPEGQPPPEAGMAAPASAPNEDPALDAIRAMGAETAGAHPAGAGAGETDGLREPSMDFPSTELPPDDTPEAHPAEFPQLGTGVTNKASRNISLLMDVQLPVSIELGRTSLPISDILEWAQGSIIELDKLAGEPVDLMVNNKLVARGEVVVVDEKFGLRITSLIARPDRLAAL